MKPQSANISYSGQKAPYLLAVYEAVPKWLGCSVDDMKTDYCYTPQELSKAFSDHREPKSDVIEKILNQLIQRARSVIEHHENNRYKTQSSHDQSPG